MNKSNLKFLNILLATSIFLNITPLQTLAVKNKNFVINSKDMKVFKRKISETNSKLNQNRNNQKKYEQLKKQLNSQIIDVTKKIDSIQADVKSLQNQVNQNQEEINLHTQEVNKNIQKINEFNKQADEINNKLNITKDSALNAAKIGYCDYKSNNFIAKVCESADISSLIKYSEYLEKTSAKAFEDMDNFSEASRQLTETKQKVEETKKQNENLKKIAQNKQDELKQKQKNLILLNEKERQGLSALNSGLINVQDKTKEMQLAEKRLEEAKRRYQKADESLQEAIEEQKRKHPNGLPISPENHHQVVNKANVPNANIPQIENGKMCFPVPSGRISSGFGPRGRQFHRGIDICAKKGTPIYAAKSGQIKFMGSTPRGGGYGGYGLCVEISHGSGLSTLYGHMSGFAPGLSNGSRVNKGQVVGYVGNTGDAGVHHLHWEVIKNGSKVNPKGFY